MERVARLFDGVLFAVVVAGAVRATVRSGRRATERRVGSAGGLRPVVQVLAAILFFGVGALLWAPIPVAVPGVVAVLADTVGFLACTGGQSLYLWGLRTLGDDFAPSSALGARTLHGQHLVTTGPYAFIRHPMYAGLVLAAGGGVLLYRTWASALAVPVSLTLMLRARLEDRVLEAEFGDAWRAWRDRVPALFPRLPRWRNSHV